MSSIESVNSFNQGLVMDLNPLTTPNNVLTNCLNGTIITYNGNEYVLQNDMGNGRVESAYLPSGYVPVGIKEHGGIIYVASYNPLTGKGQIGSFPSPERNISSEELQDNIVSLDLNKFKENLVQRIKLLDDTKIRAGDKFSIIMNPNTQQDLDKLISNYKNSENNSIKCFKNKLLTLQVSVLDSNNNLYDITKTLKRFNQDTNKEIDNSYNIDSELLFNTEYFTQIQKESKMDIDSFREKSARNVFNSKLIGNLCIIATLNTLNYFDISISGERDNDQCKLFIETAYQYNCPDGKYNNTQVYGTKGDFDPVSSILGYKIKFTPGNEYTFQFKTDGKFDSSELTDIVDNCVNYDSLNNLYKSKQLDIIEGIDSSLGIIKYEAIPISIVGELPGLSRKGQINLSQLGSGYVNLTTWKYYKNEEYTLLTWGLESYPKSGEILSNFKLQFYDIYNPNEVAFEYNIENKRNYNGIFSEILHIPEKSNELNKLFLVKISYHSSKLGDVLLNYRWLYNTTLYNEAYMKSEEQDFGLESSDYYLKQYRDVEIQYDIDSDYDRDITVKNIVNEVEEDNNMVYSQETVNKLTFNLDVNKYVSNAAKLPFIVGNIESTDTFTIDEDKTNESIEATVNIIGINGNEEDIVNQNNYKQFISIDTKDWDKSKSISVHGKAKLQYIPEVKQYIVQNCFTPIMTNYTDYFGQVSSNNIPINVASFLVYGRGLRGGDPDQHGIKFIPSWPTSNMSLDGMKRCFEDNPDINTEEDDKLITFGINEEYGLNYQEVLNKVKNNPYPITILTNWSEGVYDIGNEMIIETRLSSYDNEYNKHSFQGAFWKDIDGNPILLSNFTTDQNLSDVLYNKLKTIYKNNSQYSNSNIEFPGLYNSYAYNTNYNINCKLFLNSTAENIIGIPDIYNNSIINTLDTLYLKDSNIDYYNENIVSKEILTQQSKFSINPSKTQELYLDLKLQINGVDSLYQELSSNYIKSGYVLFTSDGGKYVLPLLSQELNPSSAYTFNYEEVRFDELGQEYSSSFIEKDGIFYLRPYSAYKSTHGRRIFKSDGDDRNNQTILILNNINVFDISFLSLIPDYKF